MAEINIDVAKEASVQAVSTKVGTAGDTASNTPTTVFAGIKGLIAWFTNTWTSVRAAMIDTINANTATNNTASKTGTLSQKESYGISLLENDTYGLSALKATLTGGSVPVVKSVQRGKLLRNTSVYNYYIVVDTSKLFYVDINIGTVNIPKSMCKVINISTSTSYQPSCELISSTVLRVYIGYSISVATDIKIFNDMIWELIEFY